MIKFFKLVYINILSFFDINKILVAKDNGVKNIEYKTVFSVILYLLFGYIMYYLLTTINISNKFNILVIGYMISTLFCFFSDLFIVESVIFKNSDNDLLFSLPVSSKLVIASKLFNVYIKNLLVVGILMISCVIAYMKFGSISETMGIILLINSLLIPCIPIVISSIFVYLFSLLKYKLNNNLLYGLCKFVGLMIVYLVLLLIFKSVNLNISKLFSYLIYVYPMNYLFIKSTCDFDVFCFISLVFISIMFIYVYSLIINQKFYKISSMNNGLKKKKAFVYKSSIKLSKVFSLVKKEVLLLFNNKSYLGNSFSLGFLTSVLLLIVLSIIDIDSLYNIEHFEVYFNLYVPTFLAMFAAFNVSTISSMSLEKDNMGLVGSLPISMGKIIFSKWLCNVLIGSIFIIFNDIVLYSYFKYDAFMVSINIVLPLLALMFNSLLGITLDCTFIDKKEKDNNVIIKQRFITLIPSIVAVLIGLVPFLEPVFLKYRVVLLTYGFIYLLFMITCIVYLIVFRKSLKKKLFY